METKDLIQKPPFSSTPVHLEQAEPQIPAAGELDALTVAEAIRAPVAQKRGYSDDEARLKEEALRNAVIEIEVLGKTAAQSAKERSEKERRIRSEIEDLRQTQEQRIEAARNGRRATQEQVREDQSRLTGQETRQSVEGDNAAASQAETVIATPKEDSAIPADVIRRLKSDSSSERSVGLSDLARLGSEKAFNLIAQAFDDQSEDVRNAAAVALFDLHSDRAATFARALREGTAERRRRIGAAIAGSGLAGIAIGNLAGQTRDKGYESFSLLFLMTKTGEVQPLVQAVEDHPNIEVRLAVVKLLALNGQAEIVPYFRQLAVRGVLPSEVRAAVIEAIYELGRQIPREFSTGAKEQG